MYSEVISSHIDNVIEEYYEIHNNENDDEHINAHLPATVNTEPIIEATSKVITPNKGEWSRTILLSFIFSTVGAPFLIQWC